MFNKPIYVDYKHEIIIEAYFDLIYVTIKELCGSDESKLTEFLDVANIIIEHHNNYKTIAHEGNYADFMSIIPTNFTAMINGFLVGYEDEDNRKSVRIYQQILTDYAYRLVKELETVKTIND